MRRLIMTTKKPLGTARRRGAVAVTAAAALVLAACGNGDDGNGGDGNGTADNGGAEAAGGGTVSAYNCEPQNLMPSNSTEVCGSWVLEQLYTGLTQVDYETYEAVPGVATDWESNEDQTEWTFTL